MSLRCVFVSSVLVVVSAVGLVVFWRLGLHMRVVRSVHMIKNKQTKNNCNRPVFIVKTTNIRVVSSIQSESANCGSFFPYFLIYETPKRNSEVRRDYGWEGPIRESSPQGWPPKACCFQFFLGSSLVHVSYPIPVGETTVLCVRKLAHFHSPVKHQS